MPLQYNMMMYQDQSLAQACVAAELPEGCRLDMPLHSALATAAHKALSTQPQPHSFACARMYVHILCRGQYIVEYTRKAAAAPGRVEVGRAG